ncbi:MAG: L,D-transpeptidase family protein [Smithella sp.]|nr:L,D-transpeptidase family protein [Syntrophaceae bacterium]
MIIVVVAWLFVVFPGYGHGVTISNTSDVPLYESPGIKRVMKQIGPKAETRIKPFFDRIGMPYPPRNLCLIVVKDVQELEIWAENEGTWKHIHTYDILYASGWSGPKLRQGDRQVPEGIYQIIALNPASRFHLSMKINYPNDYDLRRAREDKRSNLGGDIHIHGKDKSHGCVAIGDTAIEDLFVLVAKTGLSNVKVIITPKDMRKFGPVRNIPSRPSWLPDLYETIRQELMKFRDRKGAGQTLS